MSLRRVVVTGVGAISPLGVGARLAWERLIAGRCGIVSLDRLSDVFLSSTRLGDRNGSARKEAFNHLNCRVAGLIPRDPTVAGAWDTEARTSQDDRRRTADFGLLAVSATAEALHDANWMPKSPDEQHRTGVCLGTGIGAFEDVYNTSISFEEKVRILSFETQPKLADSGKGAKRVSPFFVPRLLANMGAGAISIKFGLKGPSHAASTACTTDVMVAGGAESCIHPLAFVGFERLQSLTISHNETPERASCPFDRHRDGFVIGEGAATLVLEEEEHALRRGARIYARLTGYGATSDAHHVTSPPEDGEGARRSMAQALCNAGKEPADVDYINAHATSTPLGDRAEALAIQALMDKGGRAWQPEGVLVSSTKGATGHLLGAAGATEAVYTVLSVANDTVPPTLNLADPDPDLPPFDYVPLRARRKQVNVALTNSFGFGGTNATLCFEKYQSMPEGW